VKRTRITENDLVDDDIYKIIDDANLRLLRADNPESKAIDYLLETNDEPEFAISWRMSEEELADAGFDKFVEKLCKAVGRIYLWRKQADQRHHNP